MYYRKFVITVAAICLISAGSFSQNDSARNSRPTTVAERLRQYHIALTNDALLDALQNPNSEVRYLAAEQLAANGSKDAVPRIVQATEKETSPLARVNMAFTLANLGEPTGLAVLGKSCNDNDLEPNFRALAARYMLDLGSTRCFEDVLRIANSESNTGRLAALPLLPRFRQLTKDDGDRIFHCVINALKDTHPAVRLSASDTLRMLRDSRAIPFLQATIREERNEDVRSRMKMDPAGSTVNCSVGVLHLAPATADCVLWTESALAALAKTV